MDALDMAFDTVDASDCETERVHRSRRVIGPRQLDFLVDAANLANERFKDRLHQLAIEDVFLVIGELLEQENKLVKHNTVSRMDIIERMDIYSDQEGKERRRLNRQKQHATRYIRRVSR